MAASPRTASTSARVRRSPSPSPSRSSGTLHLHGYDDQVAPRKRSSPATWRSSPSQPRGPASSPSSCTRARTRSSWRSSPSMSTRRLGAGLLGAGAPPRPSRATGDGPRAGRRLLAPCPAGPLPDGRRGRRRRLVRRGGARRPARRAVAHYATWPVATGVARSRHRSCSRWSGWRGGSASSPSAWRPTRSRRSRPSSSGSGSGSASRSAPCCSATPGPRSAPSGPSSTGSSASPGSWASAGSMPASATRALGRWPATAFLFGGLFGELILPGHNTPSTVAALLGGYTLVTLLGMLLFGRIAWLRNAELFEVYLGWLGRVGPVGRRVLETDVCEGCAEGCDPSHCVDCAECSVAAEPASVGRSCARGSPGLPRSGLPAGRMRPSSSSSSRGSPSTASPRRPRGQRS